MNKYIYIDYADPSANYIIVEDHSYCPGGHCLDFFVHRSADEVGETGIVMRVSVAHGRLEVGSISALPGFANRGIETAVMEALSSRYGLPCSPPPDPDDYEQMVWDAYGRLKLSASPHGYLHEIAA
ncbi:MAG: hypothetical protein U1E18_06485 [Brevundimonas sp.]|uniref:hypothetical protein n=1 Tax=Brevundimonas sp. TaxID=1871086 RepID=UPI002ABA715E|nr:hypothetical protein [Brevundimonas sp.]MDZ4109233.1 hypothetical protein [Brevundimonas sp.]